MPRMSTAPPQVMRHVIAALVTNRPGVLAQVAGMFAARGFNIDSLVVGRTENPEISRMTIVVTGDNAVLEQVRKQLQKLVPVVKVADYQDVAFVERDLMLVTVWTVPPAPGSEPEPAAAASPMPAMSDELALSSAARRSQIIQIADLFRAKIVDVASDRLTIELSGTEDKLEAFIRLIQPYGIVELARTGVIAMARGDAVGSQKPHLSAAAAPPGNASDGDRPGVDPASLPPG